LWPAILLVAKNAWGGNKALIKKALDLRVQYDKVAYDAEEYLLQLVQRKILPKYRGMADLLLPEEIISKNIPSQEILNARRNSFIYFKGDVTTDIKIEEFCKNIPS
jgi:hypothetical protein